MLCPHCRNEHPDGLLICPETGLPLGDFIACPKCGRIARPGASFCAACGANLPRSPQLIPEIDDLGETGTFTETVAISQGITRPSVSLVEQSRQKTRMVQIKPPVATHILVGPLKHSRAWSIIGYALLFLVILAGAAGLYLIWAQLR